MGDTTYNQYGKNLYPVEQFEKEMKQCLYISSFEDCLDEKDSIFTILKYDHSIFLDPYMKDLKEILSQYCKEKIQKIEYEKEIQNLKRHLNQKSDEMNILQSKVDIISRENDSLVMSLEQNQKRMNNLEEENMILLKETNQTLLSKIISWK